MQGFSLLEVLIALMIATSGLLGIVFLQDLALRQTYAVYHRNVAMAQAAGLMEQFRAAPSTAGFAQAFSATQQQIPSFLPQGHCEYQCNPAQRACTVSVFWQDHGAQSITLSSLI
jgi:type IV pilus modification protein PilV